MRVCVCIYTVTQKNILMFFNVIYFSDANRNFHQPFHQSSVSHNLSEIIPIYVDLLSSMLFFLAFYSSNNPEQNVTDSKKY